MTKSAYFWAVFSTGFIIVVTGVVHALFPLIRHSQYVVSTSFLIALGLVYISLYAEAGNFGKYTRFINGMKARSLNAVIYNMPKWVINLAQLFIIYIALIFYYKATTSFHPELFHRLSFAATSLMLFTLRDGLALHAIRLPSGGKRSGVKVILYYLLAYIVVPPIIFGLIAFFYNHPSDVFEARRQIWCFFYPGIKENFRYGVLPTLVEVMVAAYILKVRLLAGSQSYK